MATEEVVFSSVEEDFDFEYDAFENNYTHMINWREDKWNSELELSSLYEKTVNSLRYWAKCVKPALNDKTLAMAVFKEGKILSFSERIWIDFLKKCGEIEFFQNFFYVRNPYVIGIQFKTAKGKENMMKRFKDFTGGLIINLDWYYNSSEVNVRIHWIPCGFHEEELKTEVEKYVELDDFTREMKIEEGVEYPSSIITAKGILRCKEKDDIPHLLDWKGMQALVVVGGRKPLCLKCNVIGHKAFKCDSYHCKDCRTLHKKEYKCEKRIIRIATYAEKLKSLADLRLNRANWPTIVNTEMGVSFKGAGKIGRPPDNWGDIEIDENNDDILENSVLGEGTVQQDKGLENPSFSVGLKGAIGLNAVESEGADVKNIDGELQKKMDCTTTKQKRSANELETTDSKLVKPQKLRAVSKTYGTSQVVVKCENLFDALAAKEADLFD